jgi:acyl-CoA reductase-like NAD-dependent aldehyde dehydrogenase
MNTQLVKSLANVIRSLSPEEQTLLQQQLATAANNSLSQRQAFLQRPLAERRQILAQQAETLLTHYQEDSEWRTLMTGDIIDG